VSEVRNRLKLYGSIKELCKFIDENYEKDCYHHYDGNTSPNLILFFGKMYPTPTDIEDDKDKVFRYRMNNWGTPFLAGEEQYSKFIVRYKHSYDYIPYELTSDNNKFNIYTLIKLSEYSEMFYGENIHPSENELITEFTTIMTPPSKLITNWINVYQYSNIIFKLDYWDKDDRFVGKIYYNYKIEGYVLEHHVKEHDPRAYVYYMLDNDIKTIESYSDDLTQLTIENNPAKSDKDFNEIKEMFIEEIESKNSFDEQVDFINNLLLYFERKKA
jgi:hypothetical protein